MAICQDEEVLEKAREKYSQRWVDIRGDKNLMGTRVRFNHSSSFKRRAELLQMSLKLLSKQKISVLQHSGDFITSVVGDVVCLQHFLLLKIVCMSIFKALVHCRVK